MSLLLFLECKKIASPDQVVSLLGSSLTHGVLEECECHL
jgi:hypothetical protein